MSIMINFKETRQKFGREYNRTETVKRISTREFSNAKVSKERIQYLWSKVRNVAKVIGKFNKLNKDIRMYGAVNGTEVICDEPIFKSKSISLKILFFPDSKFKAFWNALMIFLTLYIATVLPYQLSFVVYNENWLYLDGIIDCFFLSDILITFNSAYADMTGKIITSRTTIVKKYIKSWFFIDFISSIPLEFLYTSSPESSNKISYNRFIRIIRVSRLYKMLRMLRILKTLQLFRGNYLETFFLWAKLSFNYARMFIFIIAFIISVHVSGCFWYYISKIDDTNPNTWIIRYNIENLSEFDKYISSIYFVFTTLTKIGYGDIYPLTNDEKVFSILLMGFGAGLYSYIISGLCSFVTNKDKIKLAIKEKLNGIGEFAKAIKLPGPLFERMKKNLKVNLKRNIHVALDHTQLLKEIPANLRDEILDFFNQKTVESILFFKEKPKCFINQVVPLLKSSIFVFNDIVYQENEAAEEIYFIKSGRVHLKAINNVVFRTYVQGSYFGEIEIIENLTRDSTATIASTESQLLLLRKPEFLQVINDFPDIKDETWAIAKVRKIKLNEGKAHVLDLYNQNSLLQENSLFTESDSSDFEQYQEKNLKLNRKDTAVFISMQNESERKKQNRKLWSSALDKNPKESIFHSHKNMIKTERNINRSSSLVIEQMKNPWEKKKGQRARYSSYLDGNCKKDDWVHIEYMPKDNEKVNLSEKLGLDEVEFQSFDNSDKSVEVPKMKISMENILNGFDMRNEKIEEKISEAKMIINKNLNTQKKLKELIWRLGGAIQYREL
ncbi:hypothetical protein SteCoe_18369 [Stentor coeruleus]|uniref:Cyclic nucleotide-binding domain-containing protein n=1 Tax=Stentor coeruleus TaxID=5963 RepID=A0A1R2BWK1_9CILI|nr:hypothetical protein SteCoe_18369 [Stentor coeruleus]